MDEALRTLQEANIRPEEYYTRDELLALGAQTVGRYTRISRLCKFYGFRGRIGECVRIDDFCVLKGEIYMGDFVHIASFAMISAVSAPVSIGSFVGISTHFSCFSGSDDYRASALNNPCVNVAFRKPINGPIFIGLGVPIGTHTLILPNVTIGDGASIGAHCIIAHDIPEGFTVRATGTSHRTVHRRDVNAIKALAVRVWEEYEGGTA